jgi:hypothetical protein
MVATRFLLQGSSRAGIHYDLDGPESIDITPGQATALDLKLRKTEDLASLLSNGEWIASMPGTDAQKGALLNCTGCHTLTGREIGSQRQRLHVGPTTHAGVCESEHTGASAVASRRSPNGGTR